jgi:hypothetical protein
MNGVRPADLVYGAQALCIGRERVDCNLEAARAAVNYAV